jgi:putative transposase
MIHTFIAERCSDLPISVCCRVMAVSTSGFYQRRNQPITDTELAEAHRANTVFDIWKMSRHTYGMPRVRKELRLGLGAGCSRTTTARLMGICGAVGIHYRRRGGCTRPGDGDVSHDLVNRAFDPEGPDQLWCMDITEHRTDTGKVYLAVVIDAWSRRVVGWSIADHMRAELVADAVQMATWRRRPPAGQTIAHSDHGGQPAPVPQREHGRGLQGRVPMVRCW